MNIAFDARYIEKEGSGISAYVLHLLQHLVQKSGIRVYPVLNPDQLSWLPEEMTSRAILCPYTLQSHPMQEIWMAMRLPSLLRQKSIDLLFCPAFIAPLRKLTIPVGAVIHDLAFHFAASSMNRRFAAYASMMTALAVRNCDFLLTATEAVRSEILKVYPASEDKVYSIHYGPTLAVGGSIPGREKECPGVTSPFFLFVGNIEPRKDIVRLVRMFQLLRREKAYKDHQLVLCGKKRWKWDILEPQLQGMLENVIFTGYVEKDILQSLYSRCRAVFATSVYEGFGFPVLEGMQAGKVVFASRISCFEEVGAEGVAYIDLGHSEQCVARIKAVLDDSVQVEQMIIRARHRAGCFSWKKCSDRTLEICQDICCRRY